MCPFLSIFELSGVSEGVGVAPGLRLAARQGDRVQNVSISVHLCLFSSYPGFRRVLGPNLACDWRLARVTGCKMCPFLSIFELSGVSEGVGAAPGLRLAARRGDRVQNVSISVYFRAIRAFGGCWGRTRLAIGRLAGVIGQGWPAIAPLFGQVAVLDLRTFGPAVINGMRVS